MADPIADEFEATYLFMKGDEFVLPGRAPSGSGDCNAVEAIRRADDPIGRSDSGLVGIGGEQFEETRLRIVRLIVEAGVDAARQFLDGLMNQEGMIRASTNLIRELVKNPSGMEFLHMKLCSVKDRGEGNFRFYLQPQLEKFFLWLIESNETTNYTYDITELNKEYLASMTALVTGRQVNEIDGYIREICEDEDLRSHIRGCILQGAHRYFCDLNVQYGRRIGWYALVRALKPRVVVETGVEKGMGTCVIARALMRNAQNGHPGVTYGTDIDPNAGFLVQGIYKEFGRILYGDSIQTLRDFTQPIDIFINDSAHSREYEREEYRTIRDRLTERAIILGDDCLGSNELRRFALATGRHFLFFPEMSFPPKFGPLVK